MRLVRLVLGGIVLGAAGGYAAALLRPRNVHRNPAADLGVDPAPLPETAGHAIPELDVDLPDTVEARR